MRVPELDLGIPIYPVVTNYQNHIQAGLPEKPLPDESICGFGKNDGRPLGRVHGYRRGAVALYSRKRHQRWGIAIRSWFRAAGRRGEAETA